MTGIGCSVVTSAQSLSLTASTETTPGSRGAESEKPAHPERKYSAPFRKLQTGQRATRGSPSRDPRTGMGLPKHETVDS